MSDNKKARVKSLMKTIFIEAVSEDVKIPADKVDSMDMDKIADMSKNTNVVIETGGEEVNEPGVVPYSADDIKKSLWNAYTTHVDAINLKGETPHGFDFEVIPNETLTPDKAREIQTSLTGSEVKDIGGVQFSMGDLFEVENIIDLSSGTVTLIRVRYQHVR